SALCRGADRKLQGVWDPQVRSTIAQRFGAHQSEWGSEAMGMVSSHLDKYTADWASMFQEACEARLRGEQSETVMSLRMICLDGRLREVRALTRLLSEGDPQVLSKAVDAVNSLSGLSSCADVALLTAPTS